MSRGVQTSGRATEDSRGEADAHLAFEAHPREYLIDSGEERKKTHALSPRKQEY
jgi:hypothetical protein